MYTTSPEYPLNILLHLRLQTTGAVVGCCGADHQFGRKGLPVVIKNGFEGTNFDAPALRLRKLAIEDDLM